MATRMQQRRGTQTQWASVDPILSAAEIGFESDTNRFKIGDGVNHWSDLEYFTTDSATAVTQQIQDAINNLIGGAPGVLDTLNELAAAIGDDENFVTTVTTGLSAKAPIESPTFTGTVSGITKSMVGLSNVDNTSDVNKPVSTATQTALDLKADTSAIAELSQDAVNSAIIAGTGIDKSYDDLNNTITLDIDSTVATKTYADGAVSTAISALTKSSVGLQNVDNTSDANKPVSTATQTALDLKADASDITELAQDAVNSALIAGTGLDKVYSDSLNTITFNIDSTVVTKTDAQTLTNKTLTSPVINTPTGITKSDVGLSSVDNTSDANKPISTATQSALTAAATALSNHESDTTNIHGIVDTSLLATKTYADNAASTAVAAVIDAAPAALNTLNELAAALGDDANYATTITNALALKAPLESPTFTGTVVLPTGTVTSGMILNGTIVNADINASAAIDLSKLSTDPLARANHTGTQLSSTVSDFVEAAQDAVGNSVGTGLTYTDSTGEIKVTPNTYDAYGSASTALQDAKDYADALTTSDISEGTELYFTDERAQDAVGNVLGNGLSYNDATGAISVNTSTIQARVSGVSDTEIGYLDGVTSAIQTQLDAKLSSATAATTYQAINTNVSTTELGYLDGVTSAIQTQLDSKLSKAGGTMTGALTLSGAPTSDLHAATKLYVDNIGAGLNFHQAVHAATSTNITTDYNNGTDGFGATLTALANGAMGTIDGHTMAIGDRVLVKAQTDAKQNGIYVVTSLGGASSKWVITRALDADNSPTGEIANGDFCFVQNGATSGGYGYIVTTTGTITIGTTNINYTQFNAGQAVTAGNGLTESSPGVVEIDTTVTQTRVANVSDTEIGYLDGVTSAIQTQIDSKAPINSPTFTGTVAGITKSMVGLGSVDNTSDANKPVSTAQQTALDLKANLAAPTFTGTVVLPSTTSIGNVSATEIGYVDGVTSSIQTQLNAKAPLSSPALTGIPTAPTASTGTDTTQVATTEFVNAAIANLVNLNLVLDGGGV